MQGVWPNSHIVSEGDDLNVERMGDTHGEPSRRRVTCEVQLLCTDS